MLQSDPAEAEFLEIESEVKNCEKLLLPKSAIFVKLTAPSAVLSKKIFPPCRRPFKSRNTLYRE